MIKIIFTIMMLLICSSVALSGTSSMFENNSKEINSGEVIKEKLIFKVIDCDPDRDECFRRLIVFKNNIKIDEVDLFAAVSYVKIQFKNKEYYVFSYPSGGSNDLSVYGMYDEDGKVIKIDNDSKEPADIESILYSDDKLIFIWSNMYVNFHFEKPKPMKTYTAFDGNKMVKITKKEVEKRLR